MRWLDGITDLMDVSLSELRELVIQEDLKAQERTGLPQVKCLVIENDP